MEIENKSSSDWYRIDGNIRESSKEVARESWNEIKKKIKTQWSKLLDEDLDALKDDKNLLVAKLQQVYGHAKERAEKEIKDFLTSLKVQEEIEDQL